MKICIVTYHGEVEPRGPRHAIAAKQAFPEAEVEFVHHRAGPECAKTLVVPRLIGHDIKIRALCFPTAATAPFALAARRVRTSLSRAAFEAAGIISEGVYGDRCQGLTQALTAAPADVYFAHNIEALLPAARAAQHHGAALMFDCMEFYSDMGTDGQPPMVSRATRRLEAEWLPRCKLVVASSDVMADALAEEYGIVRPLAAYNVAPKLEKLPPKQGAGLNLYWRNYMLGLGQRGLDDAFQALPKLPAHVKLFLQGSLPADGGAELRGRVGELGISDRVVFLPPHGPCEAVQSAARYDVGLCLERKGNRNHDLTVSNKMFDYLMGGLALIASDLPGLASVVHRSGGGLVFEPGNVVGLVEAIDRLDRDRGLLEQLQQKARAFALAEGNFEVETDRIAAAMRTALGAGAMRAPTGM